jgi:hypothetical protein
MFTILQHAIFALLISDCWYDRTRPVRPQENQKCLKPSATSGPIPRIYRVVTTNGNIRRDGTLVMGKGVALAAAKRYPQLPAKLGTWVKLRGNIPGLFTDERIISMPTKNDWALDSPISLIASSARELVSIADAFDLHTIAMTRPGCGNGGLQWAEVKPVLAPILDDRFIVLTPPAR